MLRSSKHPGRLRFTRRWCVALSFFAVGPAAAQFSYQFTDLGALWGAASEAHAINDQGQVVGYSRTSQAVTALLWTGGAVTALPHLAGQDSTAVDINNHGVIVGGSTVGGYTRPAVWRNGVVEQLSIDGGGVTPAGVANSINDAGVVSGTTSFRDHPLQIFSYSTAVTWDASGVRTELPDNSPYAAGLAINAAGQVAGYIGFPSGGSNHNSPTTLPTTWMPAYSTQTGLRYDARANDINDRGQFVGTTGVPPGGSPADPRAILWHDGLAVDLGRGIAYALNETAQIVGHSGSTFSAGMRATLWHDGTTLDLNTAVDPAALAGGWVLTNALDINESGSIVGIATHTATGLTHAYLLSPVPEPTALALMMAGLVALGLSRRTR